MSGDFYLQTLEHVCLSYNPLCDGINLIKFLSSTINLRKLELKNCWLSEKFFKEIETLKTSENQNAINMGRKQLKEEK